MLSTGIRTDFLFDLRRERLCERRRDRRRDRERLFLDFVRFLFLRPPVRMYFPPGPRTLQTNLPFEFLLQIVRLFDLDLRRGMFVYLLQINLFNM